MKIYRDGAGYIAAMLISLFSAYICFVIQGCLPDGPFRSVSQQTMAEFFSVFCGLFLLGYFLPEEPEK